MDTKSRLIAIIVASPLFLQNLDTSVMATALPSIAESLQVPPLHLNLAITSYLLSLAVFLPLSGWLADRYGEKRVFCLAIALFSAGSALCGIASSLPALVLFRVLQGLGGAMMVPVGRLILLRSIPRAQMVAAMVWFTVPAVLGRMLGPLFGGAVVTFTSWRWIFFVNIPFGLLAIVMALLFVEDSERQGTARAFDFKGFVLLAVSLSGLLVALEISGKALAPVWVSLATAAFGAGSLWLYASHSRQQGEPLIDLQILRFQTFRTNVLGGMPLRVAIGASPFLLPLMLQLGFGLSPLDSGLLTMATAIGALCTRVVMRYAIRSMGFRQLLMAGTLITSLFYMSYSLFSPSTSHVLIFCTLMCGGLFNSLCMVAMGSIGFSEIPKPLMSHATTLSTMVQQLTISFGVVLGASAVSAVAWLRGGDGVTLHAGDFSPAFVVIGLLTLLSLMSFRKLHPHEGADMH